MADIAALEERLATALDRIGVALAAAAEATPDGAAADPQEVAQIQEQRDAAISTAESALAEADAARAEAASLKTALEAEATANAQLRERYDTLKAMKEAQAERILALEEELREAVARRAADRTELDALIAALEPLVEEQSHA